MLKFIWKSKNENSLESWQRCWVWEGSFYCALGQITSKMAEQRKLLYGITLTGTVLWPGMGKCKIFKPHFLLYIKREYMSMKENEVMLRLETNLSLCLPLNEKLHSRQKNNGMHNCRFDYLKNLHVSKWIYNEKANATAIRDNTWMF